MVPDLPFGLRTLGSYRLEVLRGPSKRFFVLFNNPLISVRIWYFQDLFLFKNFHIDIPIYKHKS